MDLARASHILKVDRSSTAKDVMKSFRLRALLCHPDKNPEDPSAVQRFQELSAAKDCLMSVVRDGFKQNPNASVRPSEAAPAGGGPSIRKKRSGGARAQKKAAIKLLTAEGGFTDKGRMAYREEGGILATGNDRTCLPDALFVLLSGLGHPVELEDVRSIMMPSDGNTLFSVSLAPLACHPSS